MTQYLNAVMHVLIGKLRDERGLSQSTENVILLVGAVAIAAIVISVVTGYVNSHLVFP